MENHRIVELCEAVAGIMAPMENGKYEPVTRSQQREIAKQCFELLYWVYEKAPVTK